ncbi:MAG: hypothetical protein JNJ46_18055 [Myxococcales bacterium]|nr:hypothetical protein [Myxococcales bacterium]
MKRTLTIGDHLGFQWTVLRTTLAGGLLGLLHSILGSSSGYLAELSGLRGSWAWLYGATAVAALGCAALPPTTRGQRAWVLACAGLAALAGGFAAQNAWTHELWAPAGLFAVGLALSLSLARGLGLWRGLGMLIVGTAAAFGAQKLPAALGAQDAFLELPRTLSAILSGLGMGFVIGSSTVVRHIQVVQTSQLDKELRALLPAPEATDEIAGLVKQAMASYQQAIEALEEHAQAKTAAGELVKKIARFGKKWQDIEAQTKKSERAELEKRVADLKARQESASDDGVRGEYERALSALREQLTYLDEIEKGRQRAIARLHHQVATLDRLRLAAVRHRSVGAAKLGEELKTVVDELNQAGQDLDTAAELAELPG